MGCSIEVEQPFDSVLMHVHMKLVLDVLRVIDLPAGARVLDVGANIGQFAMCLLAVRPDVMVVSMEPNPRSFEVVQRNAAATARTGKERSVFPYGLDSKSGSRSPFYVKGRSGQGSLYRENAVKDMIGDPEGILQASSAAFLDAPSLRHLTSMDSSWALIKIDTEGHERVVLIEAARRGFAYLVCEVASSRTGHMDPQKVIRVLASQGDGCIEVARLGPAEAVVWDSVFQNVGA